MTNVRVEQSSVLVGKHLSVRGDGQTVMEAGILLIERRTWAGCRKHNNNIE